MRKALRVRVNDLAQSSHQHLLQLLRPSQAWTTTSSIAKAERVGTQPGIRMAQTMSPSQNQLEFLKLMRPTSSFPTRLPRILPNAGQ